MVIPLMKILMMIMAMQIMMKMMMMVLLVSCSLEKQTCLSDGD